MRKFVEEVDWTLHVTAWFNFYRSVTILFGMALFLVVVPLFLLFASCGIEEYLLTHRFRVLQIMLGLSSLAYGFFTVIRTVVSQATNRATHTRSCCLYSKINDSRVPILDAVTLCYLAL